MGEALHVISDTVPFLGLLDDLAVPLRAPGSWSFAFVPGIAYNYRLFVTDGATADLSITTAPPVPTRGGNDENEPLWTEGDGDVFDGPSRGGDGKTAVPTSDFGWSVPVGAAHRQGGGICVHGGNAVDFTASVLPSEIGAEWELDNLDEIGDGTLRLSLPAAGVEQTGTAVLSGDRLREGSLSLSFSAHRCDAGPTDPFCSVCGCYDPQDAVLDALPRICRGLVVAGLETDGELIAFSVRWLILSVNGRLKPGNLLRKMFLKLLINLKQR